MNSHSENVKLQLRLQHIFLGDAVQPIEGRSPFGEEALDVSWGRDIRIRLTLVLRAQVMELVLSKWYLLAELLYRQDLA